VYAVTGTFLTGRYPHAHGAFRNNIPLNRDEVTFAEVLRQNGYETGYVGKWHLDGVARPGWVHAERSMGFEDACFMFNRGHWKKIIDTGMEDCEPTIFPYREFGDEETYPTDWLTGKAIQFIQKDRTQPFCCMLSIPDPHTPFQPRAPYDSMFLPEDMQIPSTFDEQSPFDSFAQAQNQRPDESTWRKFKAWYYGAAKLIDENVGRLLTCLEELDILDDTIVVFTSDHGEYMGEHGLMGKNMIYETAHHVPFLIRWPDGIAQGTVIDRVVASVDFQQTLFGLVGIEPCGREQGRNGASLLRGVDAEWEDVAYIHHPSFKWAGVFTPEYEYACHETGYAMLFDRKTDSDQTENLLHDTGHSVDLPVELDALRRHHEAIESPVSGWIE
jgi:arylsulfatase A-like enzyme